MAEILQWSYFDAAGYVETDDAGQPTRVFCSSGYGMESSGGYFDLDDIFFNLFEARDTLRAKCDEKTFLNLMEFLNQYRKLPEGMYFLPECQRKALIEGLRDGLSVQHWKPLSNKLLRHDSGSMAWVHIDEQAVSSLDSIVENVEAQDLDIEYAFLFPPGEKQRIQAVLVEGADGMATLHQLYGDQLAGFQQLSEPELFEGNTIWTWRVDEGGVLRMSLTPEGKVDWVNLLEKGPAYVWVYPYGE